ncbi:MAG: hypothetical protein ACC662_10225, partial [Planctomycetota bacterium]
MLKNLGFKQRFLLVGILFFAGFGVILWAGWRTMETVRINGELYQHLRREKAVIADILPPPKYVVEPFLQVYRLLQEEVPAERTRLVDRLRAEAALFDRQTTYWDEHLPEGDLKDALRAA